MRIEQTGNYRALGGLVMCDRSDTDDSGEEPVDRPRLLTDGGEDDTRHSRLRAVFLSVTGVEETVKEQEETQMSRYVDDDTTSVSTAVTAVAADDGLTDTIDDSEPAEQQ